MFNIIPIASDRKSESFTDRLIYSTDASFYKIKPSYIARPVDEHEIIALMNWAQSEGTSLTFRAAGTSLSGQALTDSLLIDISKNWTKFKINPDSSISAQPGVIAGNINKYLRKFGRVIGPDPASINACMIGGIIANNSSGMRSGINQNAYNSVQSMKYILPGGLLIDTSLPTAEDKLKTFAPAIYDGIKRIGNEINQNNSLLNRIKQKYRIKNTVGYSLNSFVDYDNPIDILTHLMVGSEGTLGFISEATLMTFEEPKEKLTGLIFFNNVIDASIAIIPLRNSGAKALEIIDNQSLKSIEDKIIKLGLIDKVNPGLSALLIEYQESAKEEIEICKYNCQNALQSFDLPIRPILTDNPNLQIKIWSVRKGLLPALGASRPKGTTFILEDICIDVEKFNEVIPALQALFKKWNFSQTGVYGHGMDGNLHFMLTLDLSTKEVLKIYENFMEELSELIIVRFDGSMKAEHGTGRNIAPFVKKEWGNELFDIMQRIKKLIDPGNILNRGVMFNDDEKIHIKKIKRVPCVDDQIDKCIDCGFCESVCPSRELTLTPRKRINIIRESLLENSNKIIPATKEFVYDVINTCAADALCSIACPVGINTGELVKSFRANYHSSLSLKFSKKLAQNFIYLEYTAKLLLKFLHLLSRLKLAKYLNNLSYKVSKYLLHKEIYKWNRFIGIPSKITFTPSNDCDFIYFPSCVSRLMGKPNETDLPSLPEVINEISEAVGLKVKIPKQINNFCCGQLFSSKGFSNAAMISANRLIEFLWEETNQGHLSVIIDSTSCFQSIFTYHDKLSQSNQLKYEKIKFLDSSDFISEFILPKINIKGKAEKIVLHHTCSSEELEKQENLINIGKFFAEELIVPDSTGCCGMAGDRGLLYPELTKSATSGETKEIALISAEGYYSTNIPCEMALSVSTDKQYLSIAYLVWKMIRR